MKKITMSPIGIIHSPYKQAKDMPIQGKFKPDVKAWIELKEEYSAGLKDLGDFSHAIIIYYFHKSEKTEIEGKPFLEDNKHGIFAIRSCCCSACRGNIQRSETNWLKMAFYKHHHNKTLYYSI